MFLSSCAWSAVCLLDRTGSPMKTLLDCPVTLSVTTEDSQGPYLIKYSVNVSWPRCRLRRSNAPHLRTEVRRMYKCLRVLNYFNRFLPPGIHVNQGKAVFSFSEVQTFRASDPSSPETLKRNPKENKQRIYVFISFFVVSVAAEE